MSTVFPILRVSGIGSRFSLGHPLAWLGITLLLLVVGYIWLSMYTGNSADPPDRSAVKKLSTATVNTAVLAQENTVEKQQQMPITRENDSDRAEAYLQYEEVEQQILLLLDRADVHFENQQFVEPPGANAWEDYKAILGINPTESIATAGLTKIKSRLIGNAEQAIDNREFADAENWLVQLDVIVPGDSIQADLRQEISDLIAAEAETRLKQQETEALQLKIDTALSQAIEEEKNKPLNYNKIKDLFYRVVEIDPENKVARAGLERLSDYKLDEVEGWLREGDLNAAEAGIKDARNIYPDNRRVSGLELALNASLRQKEQREKQKLQQELLMEQQQAQSTPNTTKQQSATPSTKNNNETLASGIAGQPKAQEKITVSPPSSTATKKQTGPNTTLNAGIKAYYSGDYNRSFELLYPLAEEGVPRAQFRIGIMYQFGRSVAKNPDLAEKWFTSALPQLFKKAQQGVAWAQTDLGTAYEFGISLQQDYERAAYWYQQAANRGYPGAQTNLGVLYAQGDGVPYDRSKAISWFQKAAKQGDRVAIENLEILGVKP